MKTENLILTIVIAIVAIFAISTLFNSFSYGNYGYGMMGMMGNFWGGGFGSMWLFGWLFMPLIVIALVLFIAWLVQQLQHPKHRR
jgi:uncharacterized membrane protein